jgi:hypothetical protein
MRIGIVPSVELGKAHGDVKIVQEMDVIASNVFGKFTDYNHFIVWSIGMELTLILHGCVRQVWRSTWAMEENLAPC